MDMNLSKLWEIMEDRGAGWLQSEVTKSQTWLSNLATTPAVLYIRTSSFYGQIIVHCMNILHFISAFVHWLIFGFPPNILSTMMNAGISIPTQVFVLAYILLLWGLYLKAELLGHVVALCLIIWETTRMFFKVTKVFYILINSVWVLWFLYILISPCYYLTY